MGEVVDERYRIDALLGSGNTGRVYRARQLSVDRDVAVKVLRGNFRNDPQYRQRFLREAKVISGFNHPNIVRLIDFGEARGGDYSYLVMELVEGVELAALLQRGRLLPQLAFEVVYQTAAALIEAHHADIVHRDLKTQNILLLALSNGTAQVKVLDFGVAFPKDRRGERLTNAGQIFGTPAYMSPEQGEGKDVDAPADIYSLGVIFFEMLTGVLPFDEETNLATMMQHLEADRPAPSAHTMASLPQGTDDLVREMMARAPGDRPASARELRDRIDSIRDRTGWGRLKLDASVPIENVFTPFLRERGDLEASGELRALVPAFNEKSVDEADQETEPTAGAPLAEVSEAPEVDADFSSEKAETDTLETDALEERGVVDDERHPPMRAEAPDETTAEQIPDPESRGKGASGDPLLRRASIALGLLLGLAGLLSGIIYYMESRGNGASEPSTVVIPGGDDAGSAAGVASSDRESDTASSATEPLRPEGLDASDTERAGDVGGPDGRDDAGVDSAAGDHPEAVAEGPSGRPGEEEFDEASGAPESEVDESGRPPEEESDEEPAPDESEEPEPTAASREQSSSASPSGDEQTDEDDENVDESLEKSMDWLEGK